MWAVYVSEAEKYDKALVESWRGDMDGMLIFVGIQVKSKTDLNYVLIYRPGFSLPVW